MTHRDTHTAAQLPKKRLRFGSYILDLDRGCLLLDGSEIALRPKTFAVLHYLVENAGRLVSKNELFASVWPNLAVTDDANQAAAPARARRIPLARIRRSRSGYLIPSCTAAWANSWLSAISGFGLASRK